MEALLMEDFLLQDVQAWYVSGGSFLSIPFAILKCATIHPNPIISNPSMENRR